MTPASSQICVMPRGPPSMSMDWTEEQENRGIDMLYDTRVPDYRRKIRSTSKPNLESTTTRDASTLRGPKGFPTPPTPACKGPPLCTIRTNRGTSAPSPVP